MKKLKFLVWVNVKWKPKKSENKEVTRKISQFYKLSCSRILWRYWTRYKWCWYNVLCFCAKAAESKFGIKPKKKRKPDKNKKPNWKFNRLTLIDIETMRGKMSILSKTERNKDPKTRKARKVIRKYKITGANEIPSIKEKTKQKL